MAIIALASLNGSDNRRGLEFATLAEIDEMCHGKHVMLSQFVLSC